jgi:hypothetical protein
MNVINVEVSWGRTGYIDIENDIVVFDTSDGEYGPVFLPLQQLEDAIEKYKKEKQQ